MVAINVFTFRPMYMCSLNIALKSKSRIFIHIILFKNSPKNEERERWTANYTVTFNDLFACEMMEYFREQKFWGTSPLFNYPRKNEFLNMEIFYVHTSHFLQFTIQTSGSFWISHKKRRALFTINSKVVTLSECIIL